SHEIKNPITAIKNFISLIIENPEDSNIYKSFADAVPKEIYRIENMLEDLSSLSLGKELHKELCSLESIINDIYLLFEKELMNLNIRLIKSTPCPLPTLEADENKLKSVFINLIKNSIAAMPDGGLIEVKITHIEKEKRFIHIRFEDNGSGIPDHILKNIFNPFFTTKRRGLGIGLAISKGIVEQHGGEMKAFSKGPGHGTVFTISLPY
ncbi:HAMP domain-containing histidine kinase, partial [bacterium]|nr:HAMP domain-containing histidine kinase [bacterium]